MSKRALWVIIFLLFAAAVSLIMFHGMPTPTVVIPHSAQTSVSSSTMYESALSAPGSSTQAVSLSDLVTVTSPARGANVSGGTLKAFGSAPRGWFFEAQFPVMVRALDNSVIDRATAQAQGDWMNESPVPFIVAVQISTTYHGPATLVFLKDNPSGLPQNDDSVEVPIVIK